MKNIRKVQTDCELLTKCVTMPEIMDHTHNGIIIDKTMKPDTTVSYTIYIESIKMFARVTSDTIYDLYSSVQCKLYLFQDEDKVRNKIRTEIL